MFPCSAWLPKIRTLALLPVVLSAASVCRASNITYNVNVAIGVGCSCFSTAVGDITTDGAIGVLTQTDIVGWNLLLTIGTLTGPPDQFELTSAGSSKATVSGSDLSATATQLLFNFSAPDRGHFEIGQVSPVFGVCFSADQDCPIVHITGPGIAIQVTPGLVAEAAEGTQAIATAVPEPSTLAFICLGLAVLAIVNCRPAIRAGLLASNR